MFDQMKNLRNLAGMFGNMDEIREKMAQIQAELAEKSVEADAGAGAVRVTVNGKMEVVRVELDQPMIASLSAGGDETDKQMIEELIVSATNAALEKAQEMVREEMSKASGLNLPGMENLFGGGE
ncbi:MAG: YbaB/EbfC family nucleoid-associated protein [Phycisphaeraceae bacterium]